MTLVSDPVDVPLLVMVIDDDEDACDLVGECLKRAGFVVSKFQSAEDALASLETAIPHAVVTDIGLTGIDGHEVAVRLKSDPRTRLVPIVAVTGHSDASRSISGTSFHGILVKPVAPDALVQMVREVLGLSTG